MSEAVSLDKVSKVVGYVLKTGDFRETSQNLPQRIAIIGEANHLNQGALVTDPVILISAQQAGDLFGYGSPIHHIMRILKPVTNEGVGGIPIVAYPQAAAVGATSKILKVVVSGTATKTGIHNLIISGRYGVDGENYQLNISAGDNAAAINAKIETAVNAVLGCPLIADDWAYETRFESKWKGLTANDISISIDTNGNDLGLVYTVSNVQSATGTPSITAALESFGNEWNTIVINSYGTESTILTALETFNGIPDPDMPTGRFTGIIMKPFIALTGSTLENPSSITDSRKDDVTIAICPAPLSAGLQFEAAANMAVLFANVAQNTPHLDVSGKSYPDMPTPSSIGAMSAYSTRDEIVKKGCSTVDLVSEAYQVQDFVTTYHKTGENPPQFRYCRNLVIDFNIRYAYYILEQTNVVDHVIAADGDTVDAQNVIKPKQWRGIINTFASSLASRGLIADPAFMQNSIQVNVGVANPDRLETKFKYKRTGLVRISSTEATAGFNFSN